MLATFIHVRIDLIRDGGIVDGSQYELGGFYYRLIASFR